MDPVILVVFLLLFCLSAFFSGTEIALMSLAEHKIDSLIKEKKFGAKTLQNIKKNNDRLLITILIGNNLVNVYTATLATTIAISIGNTFDIPQATMLGAATGAVTFLLLLFGEIVPKSFATRNAPLIATHVAPIYKILLFIFHPIIIVIEVIIKIFTRKNHVQQVTDEEIESFIDMGRKSGSLGKYQHERIKNILDFSDTTAEEIMTPRVKIDALSKNCSVGDALKYYIEHTHSRIPVYTDTIDQIDSFMTIRDIVTQDPGKKLSELDLSKVLKVPLNKPIPKLLHTFQKSNKHLAILIDEYGGVEGLITLEDIMEEIFGEIRDETDNETDEIKIMGTNTVIAQSHVSIVSIFKHFDISFHSIHLDEKEYSSENLSYLITHKLERFPNNHEKLSFALYDGDTTKKSTGSLLIKILDITDNKIGKVEIQKIYK